MTCPEKHADTYKVSLKELKEFWSKGWIANGVHLLGCNVCEDFYEIQK